MILDAVRFMINTGTRRDEILQGSSLTERKLMIDKCQKEGERSGGSNLNPDGRDYERWTEGRINWNNEQSLVQFIEGGLPVRWTERPKMGTKGQYVYYSKKAQERLRCSQSTEGG